jgi:hypothetical protein
MPGDIQGLRGLEQQFATIGDRHVGLDGQNQIQAGAGNWLGRAVNWIKSALNIGNTATINSSIMNHVVARIRDTEGMGDRFAEIARGRLGSALTRGTPITGREVSQVIGDLVRTKTGETQAREAGIRLNIKGMCEAPSAGEGSESLLKAAMREKMTLFGMEGEIETLAPEDFQGIQDKVAQQFVRSGSTPTLAQARDALLEACRQFSLARVRTHIDAKVQQHCDRSGPDSALPTALRQRAELRGMVVDMSPGQMGKLEALVHKKLTVQCTYNPEAMHPPTDIETQALRERVIDGFLDALQVIDANTTLNPEEKTAARNAVLSAPSVLTPGMVGALCDGLRDARVLVATATHPLMGRSEIAEAVDTFREAMDGVFIRDGGLREGIDGMDEVEVVKDALFKGAFECEGLSGETGTQALERMMARGSAMNLYRFELARQDMTQPRALKNNVACLQLLTGLARHLGLPGEVSTAMNEVGLHSVTFDQLRELFGPGVHSDHGLPRVEGFDMTRAQGFLETNIGEDMHAEAPTPGQGLMANAPERLQAKMMHFSEAFLKDFFRNGIVIDGERIASTGTNDYEAMEQALDRFIGRFPSVEEAGRTTRGLFQATGASMLKALLGDPTTGEQTMRAFTAQGNKLSDLLEFSITSRGGGRYDVRVDQAMQRSRMGSASNGNEPLGLSSRVEMTLGGCDRPDSVPTVQVRGFDFFLGTMRH